jgi:hypothetical protein
MSATLVIAGIAAFGSVAVAPAAMADEPAAVQPAAPVTGVAPVAEPAPVVTAPAKPVKTPKYCTTADLDAFAKQQVQWTQQSSMLKTLAAKARIAADAVRALPKNHSAVQQKRSEAAAAVLEKAADALEDQAKDLLEKVKYGLECTVQGGPRF